jgi:hypothetical protein
MTFSYSQRELAPREPRNRREMLELSRVWGIVGTQQRAYAFKSTGSRDMLHVSIARIMIQYILTNQRRYESIPMTSSKRMCISSRNVVTCTCVYSMRGKRVHFRLLFVQHVQEHVLQIGIRHAIKGHIFFFFDCGLQD